MDKKLGKIQKVKLREIFRDEAREFTPWLEKNIEELSDVIGIEIGDVKREDNVGNFNADLVGSDANTEDKIIIENQLEQTDHTHLGQLLTYASGIEAKHVIWISKKVREEHRKTLEWLNENTESDLSFFGVEVSAIRIDKSPPAVSFELVVEPNMWSREVKREVSQPDERHKKFQQFYTRLVSEYQTKKPEWSVLTPRPASWLAFGAGRTGFRLGWAFRGNNQFSVELFIDTRDREETKEYYRELYQHKNDIDAQILNLSWEELPDRRGSRIAAYYQMPNSVRDLTAEQTKELIVWAIDTMDIFKKVLTPYVQELGN